MFMKTVLANLAEAKDNAYHGASSVNDEQYKAYYALIDQIQAAIEAALEIEDREREALAASQGPTWMDMA